MRRAGDVINWRPRRAFTLVEVLTVVSIIGVLVALTSYVYASSLARSRDYERRSDIATIQNTLEQYYLENRSYPPNRFDGTYPWVAKYQLERRSGTDICPNTNKPYLAPQYITSIPEDPIHMLVLNSECAIQSAADLPPGYGQYIYLGLVKEESDLVRDYYLFARMERANNVSAQVPTALINPFTYSASAVTSWRYNFCDQSSSDPVSRGCHLNYYMRAGQTNN
jgi:prepilin-type N-terminal cleavage/methylation domain-containing protein